MFSLQPLLVDDVNFYQEKQMGYKSLVLIEKKKIVIQNPSNIIYSHMIYIYCAKMERNCSLFKCQNVSK